MQPEVLQALMSTLRTLPKMAFAVSTNNFRVAKKYFSLMVKKLTLHVINFKAGKSTRNEV